MGPEFSIAGFPVEESCEYREFPRGAVSLRSGGGEGVKSS